MSSKLITVRNNTHPPLILHKALQYIKSKIIVWLNHMDEIFLGSFARYLSFRAHGRESSILGVSRSTSSFYLSFFSSNGTLGTSRCTPSVVKKRDHKTAPIERPVKQLLVSSQDCMLAGHAFTTTG